MLQLVKNRLKDQKGLTLIELLAVIVILGIIAAIAVPSILGLIENSKKDAHIANAQQLVNSARIAVNSDTSFTTTSSTTEAGVTVTETYTDITLGFLVEKGYLEPVQNPSDKTNGYDETDSLVRIKKETDGTYTYQVTLVQNVSSNATEYMTLENPNEISKDDLDY